MSIVEAVNQGKLTADVVRERVKPLFYTRMRLGQFDPPDNNPYAKLGNKDTETPEHQALAVEAASKSFVLLKNQNNVLPIKPSDYTKVAIVGPFSDNFEMDRGDYHARQDKSLTKTPLEALRQVYPSIRYGIPCTDLTPCLQYNSTVTQKTVSGTDLVFVMLGTGAVIEREGRDRHNLDLPGHQKQLLEDVIANSVNAQIILILFNAGPLNITFADESNRVDAILECFYPGQATGEALVNILTNKNGNNSPAGRLPVTWPRYTTQLRPIANYSMEGRTYRYMKTDPLYPFGYGLSYSSFLFNEVIASDLKHPKENLNVTVDLSNVGKLESDEVIQCYMEWGNKSLPVPQRQLVYFTRVHLRARETIKHSFHVRWDNWAYREDGAWFIQAGPMTLYCGGQQPGQQKRAPSNVISIQFVIPSSTRMDVL